MPLPPYTPGGTPQLTDDRLFLDASRQANIPIGDLPAAQTSTPPRAATPGGTGAAAGPCMSFEQLVPIKSESASPRIRNNESPHGSPAYEAHRPTCPPPLPLDQISEKIAYGNLAVSGTNLDAVLRDWERGRQLLPDQSRQRIRTFCIQGGKNLKRAFERAKHSALRAESDNMKIHAGQQSETPIVVIGDGRDTVTREQRDNMSPTEGVYPPTTDPRGESIWGPRVRNVDFERVNIRGLLCRASDLDYVRGELQQRGINLAVTSFEALEELVTQNKDLTSDDTDGTSKRRQVLEGLTDRALPDYPDSDRWKGVELDIRNYTDEDGDGDKAFQREKDAEKAFQQQQGAIIANLS